MTHKARMLTVGAVVIVAVAVFTATLVHALWYAPQIQLPDQSVAGTATTTLSAGSHDAPMRLRIPALSISAAVQKVGRTPSGNMGTPSNFTDVGWYKYGTVPGNVGSAVMAGHVDNGLSLAGVFKHLSSLHVGDDVYVDTASGRTLHFVVAAVAVYPYTAVPTDKVFGANDMPRLNLITCDGAWVAGQRTYDHRLVIYTTLIP